MIRTQLIIFVALCLVSTGTNAEDQKRLVFADSFSRNESQEEKDEVGNGWTTNADKPWARAPKQVDLRDGALYVTPADAKGSGVLVIRAWGFRDGMIEFRFMLPGESDTVGLVIADANMKNVHAGHLMSSTMKVGGVKMADMLSGAFDPEIWKRRKANATTAEDKKRIAACTREFAARIQTGRWHKVSMSIIGDRLEVKLDDKDVGSFRSRGFDHTKTTLRVTFRRAGAIDDFKLYEYVDSTAEVAP